MQGSITTLSGLEMALLGSAVTAISTSIGAIPAIATKQISQKAQDTLMGFSAGVMLAATCFSLITPALRLATEQASSRLSAGFWVSLCILSGGLFLHLCNKYI